MSDDPYVYSGTYVLINKLGIRSAAKLELLERRAAAQRVSEGVPSGNFDLAHLCAIHRHLYQDVYDWAGKIRTINIAKGGNQFQPARFIEMGMADVRRRLTEKRFLSGLSREAFAQEAGIILGDVNYCHPFREGNGRTQLQYLKQLVGRAGHDIDLTKLNAKRWRKASIRAHQANYDGMAECIAGAISRN